MKTTCVNYPGTIHGFFSLARFLSQGLKANDEAAAVSSWEAVLQLPETPSTYTAWRNVAACSLVTKNRSTVA